MIAKKDAMADTNAIGKPEHVKPQQAYDEAMRELQVRERCFPRWVKEGRMSGSDARDRLDRQAKICELLAEHPGVDTNPQNNEGGF